MNKSSMSEPATSDQDGKIVEQAKQAVTHVASSVANQAREQVNTQLDARKDKAVETMGSVASAIRETSDKLKGVGPLGDVAGRAAAHRDTGMAYSGSYGAGDYRSHSEIADATAPNRVGSVGSQASTFATTTKNGSSRAWR